MISLLFISLWADFIPSRSWFIFPQRSRPRRYRCQLKFFLCWARGLRGWGSRDRWRRSRIRRTWTCWCRGSRRDFGSSSGIGCWWVVSAGQIFVCRRSICLVLAFWRVVLWRRFGFWSWGRVFYLAFLNYFIITSWKLGIWFSIHFRWLIFWIVSRVGLFFFWNLSEEVIFSVCF